MTLSDINVCGGDIYFWRQSLVLIADSVHSVGSGFVLSFPSALIPAILVPDSDDITVTKNEASWISSINGFTGIIGFCIIPSLMDKYGRKFTHILINMIVGISFVMHAFAKHAPTLYVARSIQGLALCGVYVANIILGEYCHPKRRGTFITLKKSAIGFGSLLCHSLVLVCTWRQIAGIATITNLIAIILTFPWVESPAYYAMKGRFEECHKSFVYLHGDTPERRQELKHLVGAQEERRELEERKAKMENKLSFTLKKLLGKDFLKPFFIVTLLTAILDVGGRYYNLIYIVQIIKDITGDNSVAIYCSIGIDVLTIIASCTSSYVVTKFKRRFILFVFGYISVVLMLMICVIVYLKSYVTANWFVLLTPCIILCNSFIFNLGVVPVCFTVIGEIFPLEFKSEGTTAIGFVFTLLMAITVKYTPHMMERTGIEGTYGIYGISQAILLLVLHFILTETKDKTLQENEDELKGIQRDNNIALQERELLRIQP